MTVMSDVTADSSCISDAPNLEENPWVVNPETSDLIPDSSIGFLEMPNLENQEPPLTGMPCSSPVNATLFGPEPAPLAIHFMKDIKDPDAEQGCAGLHNMGNTCFMNAGLQCLLCNPQLVSHVIQECKLTEVDHTLAGCFSILLRKLWSGQYGVLYPSDFKDTLAMYHPQFKDYRQHDCQEFLALLLDSLHEQLNSCYCNKLRSLECAASSSQDCQGTSNVVESPLLSFQPTNTKDNNSTFQSGHPTMETVTGPAPTNLCLSEDSNQSEPSHLSIDSSGSGDCAHRLEPIPEDFKTFVVSQDKDVHVSSASNSSSEALPDKDTTELDDCPMQDERIESTDENDTRKLPSIEDLYMKDTKTLNTNVLVMEYEHDVVSTDSEKFHKPENTNRPERVEEEIPSYEQLNDLLTYKPNKNIHCKPVKDTNLLVNVREKFSDEFYSKKCLFSELDQTDELSGINNTKRMKVDEGEKNVRMQEMMKVNIDKNIVSSKTVIKTEDNFANVRHDLPLNPEPAFLVSSDGDQPLTQEHRLLAQGTTLNNEDQLRLKYIRDAQQAWEKYKDKNASVIVDTFQGQFKSTVICSECSQISVTFEPFMYLSVPLPHAMERQIGVVFVPCDNKQPIKYLLTLNKQDHVRKLKQELLRLIGEESCDIIVAEVLDNHIARILDDNTMLRFVNDSSRDIYAIEMIPAPEIITDNDKDMQSGDAPYTKSSSADSTQTPNNIPMCDNAVSSTVSSLLQQSGGTVVCTSTENPETIANISNLLPSNKDATDKVVSSTTGSQGSQLNNSKDGSGSMWTESLQLRGNVDWQRNLLSPGNCLEADSSLFEPEVKEPDTTVNEPDLDDNVQSTGDAEGAGSISSNPTDQWKSCAICLEEMIDSDLMVHTSCGGTLCQSCLEMSFKHYGETTFVCPVCSTPVNPSEDFIQLNCMADYKPKTRILSVPVLHRYDYYENEEKKMNLFGHPNIMYLASQMNAECLYSSVDRVVACPGNYSIILTDGQGYRCSRCMFNAHCNGCEVPREGLVNIQPGDHITVTFSELTQAHLVAAGSHVNHASMDQLRPNVNLSIFDCFEAFTESEILDEHNPWYCPRCKKNRCAKKTMTVWRCPETLIVYLKRFVFHELSSTKIDAKVEFPVAGLDLTNFISGPITSNLTYDLQSCVCHFGGSNSGHYTSYAKHPTTGMWHYFNDETMSTQKPRDDDYSNAYILFYQRSGSDVPINVPGNLWISESDKMKQNPGFSGMNVLPYQPVNLNNESVSEMLEHLTDSKTYDDHEKDATGAAPDSTHFDFYK